MKLPGLLLGMLLIGSFSASNLKAPEDINNCSYSNLAVNDSKLIGVATPIVVGSEDEPVSESAMLNAIEWNHDGVEARISMNGYGGLTKVGTYYYTVSGTLDGYTATVSNFIEVYDNTCPVAVGTTLRVGLSELPLSDADLLAAISVTDNYDKPSDITLNIIYNEYTNDSKVGRYQYDIKAIDRAGNSHSISNYLEIYDDLAPVISGPESIKASHELSKEEIEALYSAVDETSESLELSYDYSSKKKQLTIKAKDEAGNVATKVVAFEKIEEKTSLLFVANYAMIPTGTTLTADDVRVAASTLLNLTIEDTFNFSTSYNAKSDPGDYTVSFKYNGVNYSFNLKAFEKEEVKKENFIVRFFKAIWRGIKAIFNFFVSIIKWIINLFK